MRIKANGITFNCEIEGPEGAPWIMFSNSLATNLSMWNPQAADFKPSFRVLRYDQRGHGSTEAPSGGYTYPQLVADAVALLDALEVARTHFATCRG
jgi:3-oxoadipate enol-lactonase